MQKKHWLVLVVLIFCLLLSIAVIFWRRQAILEKQNFSPSGQLEGNQAISDLDKPQSLSQFPIQEVKGETIQAVEGKKEILTFWLECQIEKINQYRNYPKAPLIAGGWKVLADISCSYFNSQDEVEIIYLPLHIYHPEKQDYLLVGTDMQKETDEDKIRQIAEITSLTWYEKMTETFWGESVAVGKTIKIDLDYPTPQLNLEKTRGAAFETLQEPNPPYTKAILNNFYQTGDAQLLPEVDGKHYFWPVVRYQLK